ncbi:hypothetical protein OPV22_001686 [Ensete ventricosum]|uniref:Large ribosomal RNA subunit accumulation protein YCED homolog 2, chloroplastic n=1 Tax=Ensete ventricosum TaxID=4639 RepID=A0AAV8RWG4_ENSVE|nr:hypothetical protein OPV22_001686 [Ensete ventricosum]
MAKPYSSISQLLRPISTDLVNTRSLSPSTRFPIRSHFHRGASPASAAAAASRGNEAPQHSRKKHARAAPRAPRRLITISTSGGRWQGQWSCEYMFTLRELQLADIAEEGHDDADVFVRLTIQKHASFGFSIVGRIMTSFNRKCSCCFTSYCREIDTTFDVWVLPSSKNSEFELPEIGGNDPSVIYVKPGSEADLDTIIQDTIRLTASAKDTCSESCAKSTIIWQSTDEKEYDRRWYRLLEIRDAM